MQFQRTDGDSILNVGLLYLVEDLAAAVHSAFSDAEKPAELRERFIRVTKSLYTQTVRL
jgi:hypothetical protein